MSDLPKGWAEAEIGELAAYVSRGRSPKYVEKSALPVINQRCVRWHGVDETFVKFVDPATWNQWDDERLVRRNDILWNSTGTGTIGRAALFTELPSYERAVVDSHVTIVRAGPAVDPAYLFGYIKSPAVQDKIEDMQSGSTNQVELNRSEIVSTVVPVAPLPEQRRIVAKVDGLTTRTARARKELDRIPTLIARYKQRLLALAFSGELTAGWRAAKGLSDAKEVALVDVAKGFSYGTSAKSDPSGEVPVLRMGNIQDGKLDWTNLVFTSDKAEIKKYTLIPGDVLFNRTNSPELVGKTALYKGEQDAVYAGYLIRIQCTEKLMPEYLTYSLNGPAGRDYCWAVKTDGVSQSNINAKKIAAFRFLLPSLDEQAEIVRRIDSAFGWLDRMAADHAAAARLVPKLDAAILAKAFQGKLVPQDPNDEHAAKLLERIKAEREDAPKKGRGRQKGIVVESHIGPMRAEVVRPTSKAKGSSMTKSRQDDEVKDKPYLAGLLKSGRFSDAQSLFRAADLPVSDFYKQLAWEIDKGHILDNAEELKAA